MEKEAKLKAMATKNTKEVEFTLPKGLGLNKPARINMKEPDALADAKEIADLKAEMKQLFFENKGIAKNLMKGEKTLRTESAKLDVLKKEKNLTKDPVTGTFIPKRAPKSKT